jgi:hypothetical protein
MNQCRALPFPSQRLAKAIDMANTSSPRPKNLAVEDENQRTPRHQGEPPRPATEPAGAERFTKTDKTKTDPATGAPS